MEQRTVCIVLAINGSADFVRLRKLLKALLRAYGLRCVAIDSQGDQNAAERTPGPLNDD